MNTLRRGSIVVGVDESALAGQAVRWAAEQAALEGRSVRLVRAVLPVPPGRQRPCGRRPARHPHVPAPARRGAAHPGARARAPGGTGGRGGGAARGHPPANAPAGRGERGAPPRPRLARAWPDAEPPAGVRRHRRRPPRHVPGGRAPSGPPRLGARRRRRRGRRDRRTRSPCSSSPSTRPASAVCRSGSSTTWWTRARPWSGRPAGRHAGTASGGRRLVAEAMAGLRERYPDVRSPCSCRSGCPTWSIAQAASRADLLVVGHHQRGPVGRLLFGSVSERPRARDLPRRRRTHEVVMTVTRIGELDVRECRELLAVGEVGRVALCTVAGPQIVPVSYVVDGASVVFRTTPYGVLGRHASRGRVAFEVDEIDRSPGSGGAWSRPGARASSTPQRWR